MKTNDFSYFIERYNSAEMSDSERQWFLKELDGNEKYLKEVNLRKRTDEILKSQNIISLRGKLSEIEKKREAYIPVRNSKKRVSLNYAAIIAALVIIGSLTMFSGRNLSNDEIMNRYYKSYEPPTVQRSAQSGTNADYTMALKFYNTRDFEKAAIFFNKVVKSNPKDMQSTLLNGIANLENNKYPEAKQSFGNVINNDSNNYIDQAQWYLALCYVKTDEREKAIVQLEIIKKEGGVYRNNAKKIIRKLN